MTALLLLAAGLAYWLCVEIWALYFRLRFRRIERMVKNMEPPQNRRGHDEG